MVLTVRGNCVFVKPVDKPDDEPILVNLDQIVPCPAEVPDSSWLGYGNTTETHKCPYSPTAIAPARPADHHYATKCKAIVHHVVRGRPTAEL